MGRIRLKITQIIIERQDKTRQKKPQFSHTNSYPALEFKTHAHRHLESLVNENTKATIFEHN